MSRGRQLQIGDKAVTDWNGLGTITHVEILNRVEGYSSQSKIAFQVSPRLKNCSGNAWIDADWFEPAPNPKQTPTEGGK